MIAIVAGLSYLWVFKIANEIRDFNIFKTSATSLFNSLIGYVVVTGFVILGYLILVIIGLIRKKTRNRAALGLIVGLIISIVAVPFASYRITQSFNQMVYANSIEMAKTTDFAKMTKSDVPKLRDKLQAIAKDTGFSLPTIYSLIPQEVINQMPKDVRNELEKSIRK